MKIKPPCTVMVVYVLPAIRLALAKELIENHGHNQAKAAKKIQVTRAAVTQYLKGVRGGHSLEFMEKSSVKRLILEMAEELAEEKSNMVSVLERLCNLCQLLRRDGFFCKYCKDTVPNFRLKGCNFCICNS